LGPKPFTVPAYKPYPGDISFKTYGFDV